MGGCNQFAGIGAPWVRIAIREVLAPRKGTALGIYSAFSIFEIADPNGGGGSFHENRFEDENGCSTPAHGGATSVTQVRELLLLTHPGHRTTAGCVFILLSSPLSPGILPIPRFWDPDSF
jgi:hypothetical protein